MAALLMSIITSVLSPSVHAQGLTFSDATPIPSPSAEENPFLKLMRPPSKPIPLRWKIAIVLGAIVVGSGSLWLAVRVWRSSNLFDREYRFARPAGSRSTAWRGQIWRSFGNDYLSRSRRPAAMK